ncbi:putative reverse transcriptase domain-containing protein [Tanacetum coccineum]
MEEELWTLTLKGDDIEAYNNRFHELALMCPDLVPNEKKKVKRYIKGFPERIKGNITSARPTTLHDAINLHVNSVEQAVQRRQETARAYAAAPAEGKGYAGTLPKCNRCNLHHNGQCPPKCQRCQKLGHQEMDCGVRLPGTGDNHLRNVTCYGCGEKGHLRHMCPKGRNQQNEGARARAYVCLYLIGVLKRSFVSIGLLLSLILPPAALNTSFEVELADGKIVVPIPFYVVAP